MTDVPLDPIAIDVGELLQRTATSLYAHLITRPTGRAVRMAIETRLESAGHLSLSLIDFSEVVLIDFSCADEVVAKLLQKYRDSDRHRAYFVFRGVHEPHRDQVESVLERQGLAAVVEVEPGVYRLLGVRTEREWRAWTLLEERGMLSGDDVAELLDGEDERAALDALTERGLAFRSPDSGRVHALSRLVEYLM